VRERYCGLDESIIWECTYNREMEGSVLVAHFGVLTKDLMSYRKYIYFMIYIVFTFA